MTTCEIKGEDLVYITSIRQIDYITASLTRAMALKFDDDELRGRLKRNLAHASSSTDPVWCLPYFTANSDWFGRRTFITVDGRRSRLSYNPIDVGIVWTVIALVGIGLLSIYGIGAAVLLPAAFVFYKRYRVPDWKATARRINGRIFIAHTSDHARNPDLRYRLGPGHYTKVTK